MPKLQHPSLFPRAQNLKTMENQNTPGLCIASLGIVGPWTEQQELGYSSKKYTTYRPQQACEFRERETTPSAICAAEQKPSAGGRSRCQRL